MGVRRCGRGLGVGVLAVSMFMLPVRSSEGCEGAVLAVLILAIKGSEEREGDGMKGIENVG